MRTALAVALLLLCAGTARARVETAAQVRYSTRDGSSSWEKTQVTLISGQELNEATRTYRYQPFGHYAVIFFAQNQAAVVLLSGFYPCSEFGASCIPAIGNMSGEDQEGREWEICTHSIC